MFRGLTVLTVLLMLVTDYGRLGFVGSAMVLAMYILFIYIFHSYAEAADKKRKKKKSPENGRSQSSM